MESELELLTILQEERADAALEELRARFKISQVASRQVVILQVRPEQAEQVEEVDGVRAVFREQVPQAFVTSLDANERLFIKAWELRQNVDVKYRLGDGMDWDSEGFEAPDFPPDD